MLTIAKARAGALASPTSTACGAHHPLRHPALRLGVLSLHVAPPPWPASQVYVAHLASRRLQPPLLPRSASAQGRPCPCRWPLAMLNCNPFQRGVLKGFGTSTMSTAQTTATRDRAAAAALSCKVSRLTRQTISDAFNSDGLSPIIEPFYWVSSDVRRTAGSNSWRVIRMGTWPHLLRHRVVREV